ncbi:MAG TPA: hypothetical protein VMU87_09995 [Stellaceae bacterium]|nr:hypothetical protein [Stellaceae bacterium]
MLRDRTTLRSNLTAEADLKQIHRGWVARREKLPVNFAVGSPPLDFSAAGRLHEEGRIDRTANGEWTLREPG